MANIATRGAFTAFVHSLYQPADTTEEWVMRATQRFHQLFPASRGAAGRVLDLTRRQPLGGYLLHGCDDEFEAGLRAGEASSQHRTDVVLQGDGLRRLCESPLREDDYVRGLRRRVAAVGCGDMFHLTALTPSTCVTVGVFLPLGARTPGPGAVWRQTARHFETACGLQRRLEQVRAALTGLPEGAMAWDTGGRALTDGRGLTDAERARLRDVARRLPPLADSVAEAWRGVLDGRWSIVDRHAADGRRYLLALPLVEGVRDPRRLTPREEQVVSLAAEGHSDKHIAFVLDSSRSTVATQLASALKKLGVVSRVELARTWARPAS